jgi:hypothetical protein
MFEIRAAIPPRHNFVLATLLSFIRESRLGSQHKHRTGERGRQSRARAAYLQQHVRWRRVPGPSFSPPCYACARGLTGTPLLFFTCRAATDLWG